MYERDESGVLLRSVTIREPRWTEMDRAEMLALGLYRSWLCPCGCGHLSEDTFSHEAIGPDFSAFRKMCRARRAMKEAQRGLEDGEKPTPESESRLWFTEIHRKG